MFTVLCCADLYGEKVNLELTWEAPIYTLADLEARLVAAFTREKEACRPPSQAPPHAATFTIARILVYDDELLCWADLASVAQLHEYDQLYVFQPQTPWQRDTQRELPPPRPPVLSRRRSSLTSSGPVTMGSRGLHAGGRPVDHGGHRSVPALLGPQPSPAAPFRSETLPTDPSMGVAGVSSAGHVANHRGREESLAETLVRLREERQALEREALDAAEQERRRLAAEADRCLREKEDDIWRQRDALRRAEQEFQRLLQEKQRLVGLQ